MSTMDIVASSKTGGGEKLVVGLAIAFVVLLLIIVIAYFMWPAPAPIPDAAPPSPPVADPAPSTPSTPPDTPAAPSYVPPPVAVVPPSTPRVHTSWLDSQGKLGLTELREGERIVSPNGKYNVTMQSDGNLVVYTTTKAKWATGSNSKGGPFVAKFMGDGQFAVLNGAGSVIWIDKKPGPATALAMQDDGNLVVYQNAQTPSQKAVWHCC